MKTGKRIYIASSWRNQHGVELLTCQLREQGHEVISWIENNYGEKHGPKGMDFEGWVNTPPAERSFKFDTEGAAKCDLLIYYAPAGKDAAAECGIAFGNNVPMVMLWAKGEDFGLMRKMFRYVFDRADNLLAWTKDLNTWKF